MYILRVIIVSLFVVAIYSKEIVRIRKTILEIINPGACLIIMVFRRRYTKKKVIKKLGSNYKMSGVEGI